MTPEEPEYTPEERAARAAALRELAVHIAAAADLVDLMGLDRWGRHFRRDVELLQLRAQREEEPSE